MGLFDFLKKDTKKTEEAHDRWSQAYQAKPAAYRKDDKKFIAFTITEDTETVFPMDPKRMFQLDGKPVDDFRIGFCSLKEDRILDTVPFYFCIRYLSQYVVETREPYVLLRGLSHDEMQKIVTDVRSDVEARGRLVHAFEKNLEFIGLDETTPETVNAVFAGETYTFEDVFFPSGSIIAADPICYLQDPKSVSVLKEKISPGKYPVILGFTRPVHDSVRITGMKLQVSGHEAVRYALAETADDRFAGFPVETGTAAFCDAESAESYWKFLQEWYGEHPKGNFYDDYLADLFAQSYASHPDLQREGGDFIRFAIPGSPHEMVMSASGFGDGYYSVFWGYDENDRICSLNALFIDPSLYGTI